MSKASVILIFFLSQTSMIFQYAANGWNSLDHRRLNLWEAELGIHYSNVYGKILFAPLNIFTRLYYSYKQSIDQMFKMVSCWITNAYKTIHCYTQNKKKYK